MKIKLTVLFLLFAFLYSCDEGGVSPEDCVNRWTVSRTTASSASVSGGRLNISSATANANEEAVIVLSKDTLIGDFDMTVNFEEFVQGSNLGLYFYLKVYNPSDPSNSFMATMQNVSHASTGNLQIGVIADSTGSLFGTTGDYALTNSNAGVLRIRRTGSQITLNAISGTASIQLIKNYNSLPLRFSLVYGSNFQQVFNSSVKVRDCTITGVGNSSKTDVFDCNSLQ